MSQRVSFYVKKYIEGDPTIQVGLQRGLITSRVLTKHIIEEEREFRGSFDDVRNAVRKYTDEIVPLFEFRNAYTAFRGSYVDVRSKLASIETSKNADIKNILRIIGELSSEADRFIRVSNNGSSFILFIREEDLDKTAALIKNENILSIQKDISSINIHLDSSVKYTQGVYFLIMGQISLNQINIYDVSSYQSEFSLYVDQKDGAKVYKLLSDLSEYEQKFCQSKR